MLIALRPERFRASGLAAHSSWQTVVEQALEFRPDTVVLVDEAAAAKARAALEDAGSAVRVEGGCEAAAPGVTRVVLTASGRPFRTPALDRFESVTPEEACNHPKWKMGRKISVDSATLMNKGLEVIEATLLFSLPESQVHVVVHPQSLVHSLVEYADGSLLAQMGAPDMRTPIAQALAWPERVVSGVQSLDMTIVGRLDFEPPDHVRFPSLDIARAAARAGGTAPAVLNAAKGVAVQAFLDRRLNFTGIA